jgi:hypothetical protein
MLLGDTWLVAAAACFPGHLLVTPPLVTHTTPGDTTGTTSTSSSGGGRGAAAGGGHNMNGAAATPTPTPTTPTPTSSSSSCGGGEGVLWEVEDVCCDMCGALGSPQQQAAPAGYALVCDPRGFQSPLGPGNSSSSNTTTTSSSSSKGSSSSRAGSSSTSSSRSSSSVGPGGWVWCPECGVARYCSRACEAAARRAGRHSPAACGQLRQWQLGAWGYVEGV